MNSLDRHCFEKAKDSIELQKTKRNGRGRPGKGLEMRRNKSKGKEQLSLAGD